MNKLKVVTATLGVCVAVLAATPALAADTTGSVRFIPDSGDTSIVKPKPPTGTEEIIELPGEGNSTTGEVRLAFVPNLTFADQKITAAEITSNAKYIKYNKKGESDPKYIPPFLQVAYGSGDQLGFRVNAKVGEFKSTSGKLLTGATIKINESKLFNNYKNAATILENDGASDMTNDPIVLATKANQTADGTISSNVFDAAYNENTVYSATDTTTGIQFVKPRGEAPANELYKATITWNFVFGL